MIRVIMSTGKFDYVLRSRLAELVKKGQVVAVA